MPLYEFLCGKCEREFELLVRSSDWQGEAMCPHCNSTKLTKKLSAFAPQNSTSAPAVPQNCAANPRSCACRGGQHRH